MSEELLSQIKERYSDSVSAKQKIMTDMQIAYRAYNGEQFLYAKNNRIISLEKDIERYKKELNFYLVTRNKIKPATDVVVSRLTQRQPQLLCNPKISHENARRKAKIWGDVLTYYRLRKEYLRKDIETAMWTVICGKGYKWVHPVFDRQRVKSVEINVLSPFQFHPTPGVREINQMPWIIVEQLVSREALRNQYGVKTPPVEDLDGNLADAMRTLSDVDNIKKMSRVLEYFEKPSPSRPRGLWAILAENTVLEQGDFPYWNKTAGGIAWGGYRIQDYTYRRNLLTHWGTGLPQDCMNAQKMINLLQSQWATYVILTAAPKGFYEKGDPLPPQFMRNFPGMFAIRDMTKIPRFMEIPRNSPEMAALLRELENAFDEQAGVHSMSTGDEPIRRMPYLAIQYLTEMDMDKFRPIFDNWEESDRLTGWNILSALQQYGREPLLNILGPGRQSDIELILDDDLNDLEIDVERGSSLPQSRAGQIGMALDALKYGAFNMQNPVDRTGFLRAINTGWAEKMMEDETQSADLAERENELLTREPEIDPATGDFRLNYVPVSPSHNHFIHLATHNRKLDSPDYLEIMGTAKEQSLLKHREEHLRLLAESQAKEQGKSPLAPPKLPAESPEEISVVPGISVNPAELTEPTMTNQPNQEVENYA